MTRFSSKALRVLCLQTLMFVESVQNMMDDVTREPGFLAYEKDHSYFKCSHYCESWSRCAGAKYKLSYNLCVLYDTPISDAQKKWTRIYNKPENIFNQQKSSSLCQTCTSQNVCLFDTDMENGVCLDAKFCPPLVPPIDAHVIGNQQGIGSHLLLKCNEHETYLSVTCLENGTWSNTDLNCLPDGCPWPIIQHGQNIHLNRTNQRIETNVICDTGYQLVQDVSPVCDLVTNTWSSGFDRTCCDSVPDPAWVKFFSYPAVVGTSIESFWRTETTSMERNCQYKNKTMLDNLGNSKFTGRIKVNVVKDENVVAFVILNGTNSYDINWFNKTRILESSWDDLNENSVTIFNFYGHPEIWGTKFLIAENIPINGDCNGHSGWLAASWGFYPCKEPDLGYVQIMYAKGKTASEFIRSELGFADRIEFLMELNTP